MRTLWIDVKYAVRTLLSSPGFATVAVISLALGIGANTTMFSIVHTLLFEPLPVSQPDELVSVFNRGLGENEKYNSNSYPEYEDLAARDTVFSGVACAGYAAFGIKGEQGDASIVLGQSVSANFFDVIGVTPIKGRNFTAEEGETEGAYPVALMSEDLWKTRFGGDEDIIGRSLMLNGYPFTVVGVMPASYSGLNIGIAPQLWVPLMMHQQVTSFDIDLTSRGNNFLNCIARLKPGQTIEQAEADMAVFASNLEDTYPDREKDCAYTLVPANDNRILVNLTGGQDISPLMFVLMGVVGLVLLIACSNVASILLARASGRRKEIAIRLAMGAGRIRIVRQLLTESLMLSIIAGGAGVLLAMWSIGLLHGLKLPFFDEFPIDFGLNPAVLIFTLAVSMLTGVIFGLVPAWQMLRPNIVPALKDQGKSASQTAGKSRLQGTLVVVQVAMSLFLLVTAGMFLRSLQNAEQLDVGFEPEHNAVISIDVGLSQYDEEGGARLLDNVLREARALPGVIAAGYGDCTPFGFNRSSSTVSIPGYEPREDESMDIYRSVVTDGYFPAMGIPILQGREFEPTDDADAARVMVINQAMADRFFDDGDAVNQIVRLWGEDRRVVGVVKTCKYFSLRESETPYMYLPQAQEYSGWQGLHLRTSGDPQAILGPAARIVAEQDPNLPLFSIDTMANSMGMALLPARVIGSLVGMFGFIALVLAITGIYGVMAYSVSQRTNEFGIRMAIGAQRSDVLRLVLGKGMLITTIGLVLGLGLAMPAGFALSGFMYDVMAVDPVIFSGVVAILVSVAVLACYIPARRAMAVNPMSALRYE